DHPVYFTSDGTDRVFVVEQPGRIRMYERGNLEGTTYLDIKRDVYYQGECGLLSMAFHPQFAANGLFYVNYTSRRNGKLQTFISEFTTKSDSRSVDRTTERVVMTIDQPYANHNGGQIQFGPDGMLYIGMGDGGSANDPEDRAQNLKSLLGKMLRIDVTPREGYAVPKDNPFMNRAGARPEIWAFGLRNPWRFMFDSTTGDCITGDVGQNQYEEVHVVEKGGNYGWRPREGFHQNPNIKSEQPISEWIDPIAEYTHKEGQSITGGYVYRGKKQPKLQGTYVYADFASGRFWGLRYEKGKRAEPIEFDVAVDGRAARNRVQPSSFGTDAAGEMYVCDHNRGTVYRLEME
ncbi:MAG TPA: PQQ-dependent sugar dehydrogenase, partial [Tepidisphaeraceae bacterium]